MLRQAQHERTFFSASLARGDRSLFLPSLMTMHDGRLGAGLARSMSLASRPGTHRIAHPQTHAGIHVVTAQAVPGAQLMLGEAVVGGNADHGFAAAHAVQLCLLAR